MKKHSTSYKLNKKVLVSILAVILVALLSVGAVYAYLSGKTPTPVKNTVVSDVDKKPVINETVDDDHTVKQNVYVEIPNTDYDVYVRSVIVVNWIKVDDNGNVVVDPETGAVFVHADKPRLGIDYKLDLSCDDFSGSVSDIHAEMWTPGTDGFYYYSSPVVKEAYGEGESQVLTRKTAVLINNCSILDGAVIPEGYTLNVEIAAQVIQALGATDADDNKLAVVDAWDVSTIPAKADLNVTGGNPGETVLIYKGPLAGSNHIGELDDPGHDPTIPELPDDPNNIDLP